jgi:peptide-methionine (S)-S-oxide reductase
VVRTRVGYAGGTTPSPTYHRLGDHSETIEIDYDPSKLSYADLLAIFFESHSAQRPSIAVQYRSAVFYRTDEEKRLADEAIARMTASFCRPYTTVERFDAFHLAEDYHQKYTLRRYADLTGEFRRMLPAETDFVASTATARVNGWLSGCATAEQLDCELELTGLSDRAQATVRAAAMPRGRARIGCGA